MENKKDIENYKSEKNIIHVKKTPVLYHFIGPPGSEERDDLKFLFCAIIWGSIGILIMMIIMYIYREYLHLNI